MIIVENIYEAMLVAAFFAPLHWFAMVGAALAIILLRKRLGTLVAAGLIVMIAVTTWLGSLWLAAQCTGCNLVDRIYQTETRWGFLFWEIAFFGILLALQAYSARQARQIKKET